MKKLLRSFQHLVKQGKIPKLRHNIGNSATYVMEGGVHKSRFALNEWEREMVLQKHYLDPYLVNPKKLVVYGQCFAKIRKFGERFWGRCFAEERFAFHPDARSARFPIEHIELAMCYANHILVGALEWFGSFTERQARETVLNAVDENRQRIISAMELFKWYSRLFAKARNAYVHASMVGFSLTFLPPMDKMADHYAIETPR